jgi:broad specificity phosphatase PhoE
MSSLHVVGRVVVLLLGVLAGCASAPPVAPKAEGVTTVFLVRHAEKDPTPDHPDPALTPAGERRAEALRDTLRPHSISALYTTDTVRTRATLAPLAQERGLEPRVYDAREPQVLAGLLREQHRGQTVVVVGHSNTLLPLLDALGAARPVPELTDADYDYLFEVTLRPEGGASARAHRYGASHHAPAAQP